MKGTQRVFALAFFCIMLALPVLPACADEFRSIEDSSAQEVVSGMGNKAARGITNAVTGWLEFPKQIYVTSKEDGAAKGIFIGPLKGIGMTVVRTLVGVGEIVTFFIPYPGFYDPFIEPAYVWQEE
jgi:putative exosortase-associated protein (TIGR04073 family)